MVGRRARCDPNWSGAIKWNGTRAMFAILGLVGLALSTVMITGPDWSEQDTATDSDDSATDLSEPDAEIVSVDAILGETASGISEQTPNDAQIFSGSADDLVETGSGNDLVDA